MRLLTPPETSTPLSICAVIVSIPLPTLTARPSRRPLPAWPGQLGP
jgi:hypothetical protein